MSGTVHPPGLDGPRQARNGLALFAAAIMLAGAAEVGFHGWSGFAWLYVSFAVAMLGMAFLAEAAAPPRPKVIINRWVSPPPSALRTPDKKDR